MKLVSTIVGRFSGSGLGAVALRNMLGSVVVRVVGIAISLFVVPLTLGYLAEEEYGIWLTLSSMLAWIGFFDIGLTNGLRNKLTEALTLGDINKAKIYVSTTFVLLSGVIGLFLLLFFSAYSFVDWQSVFNTQSISSQRLGFTVLLTVAFFCVQFVLKIVTTIYFASQKAALADVWNLAGSAVAFLLIWILTLLTKDGDLLYVAMIFSGAPVVVFMVAYLVVFYGRYKHIRPSLSCVHVKYSKDLIGLGLQFFVAQSAALVLFTTSNFIITQLFGPSDVTVYNIAFKYFSIVTMVFTIVMSPMWNAYTEAYVRADFEWMRRAMRKTRYLWALGTLGTVVMVAVAPWVYEIWVGADVAAQIPVSLSVACALFVTISNWNNNIATLINGVGKIWIQLIGSIVIMMLFIPLAVVLAKWLGIIGILCALCLLMLGGAFWGAVQVNKIVNQTAKGIWNK